MLVLHVTCRFLCVDLQNQRLCQGGPVPKVPHLNSQTHLYTTHASVQVCGRTRALQLVTTCACMRIAMTGTSRLFKRVHALASDHTVHTTGTAVAAVE